MLIHLHVPKTGGTSLSRMLRLRLLRWPPTHWLDHAMVAGLYNVPWLDVRFEMMRDASPRRQRRVRFFGSHHFGYGVHEHLPAYRPPAYLTVLRDPVERVLSTYGFLRAEGRVPDGMSLHEFIHQPTPFRTFHMDNGQLRFLAGDSGAVVDVPHGACTVAMADVARRRLDEMFWVGIIEDFTAGTCRLADALGWSDLVHARSKTSSGRPKRDSIPRETLDAIIAMNELDQLVYDHAAALHRAAVAAMGRGFAARVARCERRNRRFERTFGRFYDLLPTARRALEKLHLMPDGQRAGRTIESPRS